MSDQRLAGKVAIVTGASSGIGKGIAIRFAKEGADVVVNFVGDDSGAHEAKQQIEQAGRRAIIFAADISKPDQVEALVDAAWKQLGKADVLINNAGVEKNAAFTDVSEHDYDLVLDVNLKGPFFATQSFVKRLIAANMPGKVVNISSVHEDMVFPNFASYCAAKGGLRMLMRNLAVELGSKNITVNNIAPGAISTPINSSLLENKEELSALVKNIPVGRIGTVEDVASLAVFLSSEEAAYVTGSTYVVDGGLMRNYHEQ